MHTIWIMYNIIIIIFILFKSGIFSSKKCIIIGDNSFHSQNLLDNSDFIPKSWKESRRIFSTAESTWVYHLSYHFISRLKEPLVL